MKCPGCGSALQAAKYRDTSISSCRACGGVWCAAGRLAEVAGTKKDLPPVSGKSTGEGRLCPACPAPIAMEERPYLDHTPLRIDVCVACEGVWFDRDELREALRLRRTREYYKTAVDPTVSNAVAHAHRARRALALPIQWSISPGGLVVGLVGSIVYCFYDLFNRRGVLHYDHLSWQWPIVIGIVVVATLVGAFTPDLRPARITR